MELPMKNLIARFVKDESGATAIEYGLIAAGISLAIIAVVNGLGTNLNGQFASINNSLKSAIVQSSTKGPGDPGPLLFRRKHRMALHMRKEDAAAAGPA